ncbi:MAG: arylsulfotransferase family protein [Gammaproteobacteria bacterium]
MDRIFYPLLVLCVAFLTFVGGAFVVLTKVFPYEYFNDAYEAMVAVYHQRADYKTPYQTNLWRPTRTDERGVTTYKRGKAYNGLTLYASSHAQKAFLITMDGKVAHEWSLPLRSIWENRNRKLRPDGYIGWEYIYMYPNGDLIAMYVGMGDTPWGYGLVKMDKDSKVIWKYWDYTHHHLDVAEDGKIYVLTNEIHKNVIKGYEHLAPPRLDDYVVVLSPDGKRLKKVSILDALLRSRYGRMMRAGPAWNIKSDFLHSNSVEFIDSAAAAASKLPDVSEGQVLLSLRDIDVVAALDLEKEEVVWAVEGSWHRQHDADMLPNGNIMLFDNWGHYGPGGGSRVYEFKPSTLETMWTYAGDAGDETHFFESGIRSGQRQLPNGNVLITESDGGRLLEVDRSGEIVWEFINPVRGGAKSRLIPVLFFGVQRYTLATLDPEFRAAINNNSAKATARSGNR